MKSPGEILYVAWNSEFGTSENPAFSKLRTSIKLKWEQLAQRVQKEVSVQTIDELIGKFQEIKNDILS